MEYTPAFALPFVALKTKKAFFSSNALKINQNVKSAPRALLLHFYERLKTVGVHSAAAHTIRRSADHSSFLLRSKYLQDEMMALEKMQQRMLATAGTMSWTLDVLFG